MTIKDIFQGCESGRIQTVGSMTMIPITSKANDDRFISPKEAKFRNHNYGSMTFNNETEKTLIVPMNIGYVTKHSAQDHAMTQSGIVPKKDSKTFTDAACIQESQGGYIPEDVYDFLILPWSLRSETLSKRGKTDYSKIWGNIRTFNRELGLSSAGHMEYFLKSYEKELDEFVAEFELIPNQVGAIILINGTVFGVEKAPSSQYFSSIFKALVRDCYGSAAIQFSKGVKYAKTSEHNIRIPVKATSRTINGIKKSLAEANKKQDEVVKNIVRDLLPEELKKESSDSESDGFSIETYKNEQFFGQVISENNDDVIYASLSANKNWVKTQGWIKTKKFSI
jgi:hypothetical protein